MDEHEHLKEDPATASWHLDRRVPIALILVLIGQTFGLGWWASSISSRVDQIEIRMAEQGDVKGRIGMVETHLVYIRESLARMEKTLTGQQPRRAGD